MPLTVDVRSSELRQHVAALRQQQGLGVHQAVPPLPVTSAARCTTWSTKPYSFASSAENQRSRSESAVDLLDGLAGLLGDQLGHLLLDVQHLLGLDLDVRGGATDAAGRLVHHDPRVRQAVPLALGARAEQELPHRGGQAHADRRDVVAHELHRVVDRHARGDGASRRVDVQVDVPIRVLGRQQQHLGADQVRDSVLHRRSRGR
jgi:hypothetical protein